VTVFLVISGISDANCNRSGLRRCVASDNLIPVQKTEARLCFVFSVCQYVRIFVSLITHNRFAMLAKLNIGSSMEK